MENTIIVNTWNDLLNEVKEYKSELSNNREIWYRGQSNAEYSLLPSLFRNKKGIDKEKVIFNTYRKLSQHLKDSHQNEWNLLIDMQHYFVPTRLLDWSESLGVALFFAVTNHQDDSNIALFLLDPIELNLYSSKAAIPIVPEENMGLSYIENYINKIPFPPMYPIAIKSQYINNRIMAQRGMFTIHGDNLEDIEKLCPKAVKKIVISKSVIPEIKEFLEFANINEFTVFPDLHGISNYIRSLFYNWFQR